MELIKKARTKMLQFYLQLLETEEELQKFTQLYETYRKLMHWTAEGILHDEHLAEDAVHEAFLRIIQSNQRNSMSKNKEFCCYYS